MKRTRPLIIHATWDDEAKVWVATSDDVPGLVTEATSFDTLMPKLKVMIPELLDANGYPDGDEIPFRVLGEINDIVCREAA
jgi:predicted RNase H-like HicB family nuclease